jgi:hypothetical protein
MKLSTGYIAGYFDGEGCIGIYRNRGSKDSRYKSGFKTPCWIRSVSIVNTHLPTLIKLRDMFGGGFRRIVKDEKYKPCYQWTLGAKHEIGNFLNFIYPSLQEKKPQAKLMIEECLGKRRTWSVAKKLKSLKRRHHVA